MYKMLKLLSDITFIAALVVAESHAGDLSISLKRRVQSSQIDIFDIFALQ